MDLLQSIGGDGGGGEREATNYQQGKFKKIQNEVKRRRATNTLSLYTNNN